MIPYKSSDTTAFLNGYRAGNPLAADAINAVKELSPDVIHTHCPASSTIMARVLRKETGAPIIYTHHTKYDIDMAVAVKSKFIVKESMRALVDNVTACDEIWTVSRGAGENLRNLGFEGDYIVMNNGVDFAKGRADDESVKKAVRDYDLPAGLPVFLYVGRIMKYKGLPLIIDALKRLAECGKDFRMVIVGSGKESEEVRAMVTEAGLTRYIRKDDGTGTQEHPPEPAKPDPDIRDGRYGPAPAGRTSISGRCRAACGKSGRRGRRDRTWSAER